jgi:hypothetical protein
MPLDLLLDFAHGLDPAALAEDRLGGFAPIPGNRRCCARGPRGILLNCCRQSGKSTTTALTKKIGLPSVLPVRIQVRCAYRKIATRLRWDGAESLGFVGGVADGDNTAHHLGKYLFVLNDIDMKRTEGSSALIGEPHQPAPFEFHLGAAQRRPNCRARIGSWLARAERHGWRGRSEPSLPA